MMPTGEYAMLRSLLEEVGEELGVIFEHGLSQGGRQEGALRTLGERMDRCGLLKGADLAGELCGQLAAARLDTRWEPGEAAILYAGLWRYLTLCLRRLEFLEARARIAQNNKE